MTSRAPKDLRHLRLLTSLRAPTKPSCTSNPPHRWFRRTSNAARSLRRRALARAFDPSAPLHLLCFGPRASTHPASTSRGNRSSEQGFRPNDHPALLDPNRRLRQPRRALRITSRDFVEPDDLEDSRRLVHNPSTPRSLDRRPVRPPTHPARRPSAPWIVDACKSSSLSASGPYPQHLEPPKAQGCRAVVASSFEPPHRPPHQPLVPSIRRSTTPPANEISDPAAFRLRLLELSDPKHLRPEGRRYLKPQDLRRYQTRRLGSTSSRRFRLETLGTSAPVCDRNHENPKILGTGHPPGLRHQTSRAVASRAPKDS